MGSSSKRSWQLQDFMAHGANVNCLALGQKSGRVLVTGGDDKKVNLWAIGQQNCIMSLAGHLTPVECVKFDHLEEKVCAGSQAGALKLWDLDEAKLFRTLTSHKSGIKCIDFHPYGNFFASGSLDTSIKLWDYRKRECIFTYKGHQETVNCIKFSPDGQWIASGGEEGDVKIWDLRAGRVLSELVDCCGAVTDVEFHPQEFLLASSGTDRSVSFWDLENFCLVSKMEKETSIIRCLYFNADGKCLFGGCAEQLKVYGWEPARVFDTVTIGWGKVQDMASLQDQLIGASFNLTRILICVVDTTKVSCIAPQTSHCTNQASASPFKLGQTVRKSFNKRTPKPKTSMEAKPIDEEYDTDDNAFNCFMPNVDTFEAVFQPHRSLNRSPPPPLPPLDYESDRRGALPHPPPFSESITSKDDASVCSIPPIIRKGLQPIESTLQQSQALSSSPTPSSGLKLEKREDKVFREPEHRVSSPLFTKRDASKPITVAAPNKPSREPLERANSCKNDSNSKSNLSLPDVMRQQRKTLNVVENHATKNASSKATTAATLSPVPYNDDEIISSMNNAPIDLRLEEFLPQSYRTSGLNSQSHSNLSEMEIVSSLESNHKMVLTILKIRQRNLEIIYSLWNNQDLKCALEGAVSMNDQAVLIDVLSAINKRPSIWNLDVCTVLLPAIHNLLYSKYEMYMSVCCESLLLILKNFSSVIKANVQWSSPTIGVDISKEERYTKCVKCYENLIAIRTFLLKRQTMQGKLGQSFRELQAMLYAIEK